MRFGHFFFVVVVFGKFIPELSVRDRELQCYLEVVHQPKLTAALLADREIITQRAGGVGTVHCVAHSVIVVPCGIPDDAGACRRREATQTLT